MPATKKQTGYLVKIEAFIPSDMTRMQTLVDLQKIVGRIQSDDLPGAGATITPTRR